MTLNEAMEEAIVKTKAFEDARKFVESSTVTSSGHVPSDSKETVIAAITAALHSLERYRAALQAAIHEAAQEEHP